MGELLVYEQTCGVTVEPSNVYAIGARIFRFTDKIFCRYLYSQFINTIFNDRLTDKNILSVRFSSVIYSLSVIKLSMNLLTEKTRQKKKLPASFHWYFPWEI